MMTVSVKAALNAVLDRYLESGSNPQNPLVIEFSSRVARDEFMRVLACDIGMTNHEMTRQDHGGRREPPMYNGIEFRVRAE
jgi:hypothetical protein